MSKKKWFVTVALMRGIGEQHAFIKLDIEQAEQLLRFIEEIYHNCVEVPVEDVLMENILTTFESMEEIYDSMHEMEQSGLD